MTEETKQKLKEAGRQDLIDTNDILESGFAGINRKGMIVDRRINKEAVPIPYNKMFPNTPEPKDINNI